MLPIDELWATRLLVFGIKMHKIAAIVFRLDRPITATLECMAVSFLDCISSIDWTLLTKLQLQAESHTSSKMQRSANMAGDCRLGGDCPMQNCCL